MDFLLEMLLELVAGAPLEAVMAAKIKCRIKTAVMTVFACAIVGFLLFTSISARSVLCGVVTAALAAFFGWGIVRGHRRGWKNQF